MNRQVEANLSMVVSKALGGLNMNALKYLLPLWIAPVTGVTFRLVFGAAAFWLIDIFCKPENSTIRQKWQLFILGALGIYGYMFFYLLGISKTTPVSSSIFVSLEPMWVFIISVLFYTDCTTAGSCSAEWNASFSAACCNCSATDCLAESATASTANTERWSANWTAATDELAGLAEFPELAECTAAGTKGCQQHQSFQRCTEVGRER